METFRSLWFALFVVLTSFAVPQLAGAAVPCGTFQQIPTPNPGTTGNSLVHLAANSDGTAWAVGSLSGPATEPLLLYYDGSAWAQFPLPAEVEGIAFSSSGSTPDGDVWLAGTRAYTVYERELFFLRARGGAIDRIDRVLAAGAPLDLTATSASDVWALTATGSVIHFDGSGWTERSVPAAFSRLLYPRGIYAAGPEDVWIVGYGGNQRGEYRGYAQHWDGSSWSSVATPVDGQRSVFFRDIDGSASNDIWIVGYFNYSSTLALHWNGSAWVQEPGPPSDAPFAEVATLALDDAWAAPYSLTADRTMFHWDGAAWGEVPGVEIPDASTIAWRALSKAGPCDVWATGSYYIDPSHYPLVARLVPGADAFVHVQDVGVERVSVEGGFAAVATVLLATDDGAPASGVQVTGDFTGPSSGTDTALTDTAGIAQLMSPAVASPDGVWCFDVTKLIKTGWIYDSEQNFVTGSCEDPGSGTPSVFVSDISVTKVRVTRRTYQGQATVAITDRDGGAVTGARVSGHFSGPTSESLAATTGANGVAHFASATIGGTRDAWCFTVDDVTASTAPYDSGLNVETTDCQ